MASTVWIVRYLWLIPALPILAAGIGALLKQGQRKTRGYPRDRAHESFFCARGGCLCPSAARSRQRLFFNFPWMQFGSPNG